MQEIMYYLPFSSCKNHFLVQIYVDLFIPKWKSERLLHACILEMRIRLIHAHPCIYPKQSQLNNILQMYMINLMIIYDMVNIFSMKS